MALPVVIVCVSLLLGILYCFRGYRYLKATVFIFALVMGAYYANMILSQIALFVPGIAAYVGIIAAIAGLVCALLSVLFINFGIFLTGGLVGLIVFSMIRSGAPHLFYGLNDTLVFIIGLGLFIAFGTLTFASRRHFMILFTSIFGAYVIAQTAGILIGLLLNGGDLLSSLSMENDRQSIYAVSVFSGKSPLLLLLPAALFAVAGAVTQYKSSKK